MRNLAVCATLFVALSEPVFAQETSLKLELTCDRGVYRSGVDDPLIFTIKNHGNSPALIGGFSVTSQDASLTVFQGGQPLTVIEAGQSTLRFWNRKNRWTGQFAPPGSYIITVVSYSTARTDLSRTVALTSTATLAGDGLFPLGVGNRWTYVDRDARTDFPPPALTTDLSSLSASWYQANAFVVGSGWLSLTGGAFPTAWYSAQSGQAADLLFRFGRSVGYSYTVGAGLVGPNAVLLHVTGTNLTVVTRAAKFTGCYRLDVTDPNAWFGSFWFAPGFGLVQYTRREGTNPLRTLALSEAKIQDVDGLVRTVSGTYSQIWESVP